VSPRQGGRTNDEEAVALVRTIVPKGEALARDLARLLALKDDAQDGVLVVSAERCRSLARIHRTGRVIHDPGQANRCPSDRE